MKQTILSIFCTSFFCLGLALPCQATWTTQWQLGDIGRGWPTNGVGGGPDVDFVQEGGINPAPGDPNSPSANRMADDDYYFSGVYPAPIGLVPQDEIAMERAFGGGDLSLRIHFNLPDTDPNINASTRFRFNIEPNSLSTTTNMVPVPDPRFGLEVRYNGVLIQPEVIFRPADLNTVYTTPEFTLGDVGATFGLGGANVLELTGISYNSAGPDNGGNWMGMDYHMLELNVIPEPSVLGLLLCGSLVASLGFRKRKKS